MGQDICIRKDEKPLGYDWECGHEKLYVRVNMYYNRSLVLCSGSFMPEHGIKGAAIQIVKLPAMKSREESSLQMERKFQILFMACLNSGKCDGFHMGNLGIILAAVCNSLCMYSQEYE